MCNTCNVLNDGVDGGGGDSVLIDCAGVRMSTVTRPSVNCGLCKESVTEIPAS